MHYSPPGFSVHGIIPARILAGAAISSSRGSFQPRNWTPVSCNSCNVRRVLCHWAIWEDGLPCLYLDKHLLKQQNTNKLQGTKNNCVYAQLGQIMNKIQKDQKPNCHFETEIKAGYCTCTPHEAWTARQWADHPSHSCSLTTNLPLPSPHLRYQLTTPRRQSEPTCHLFSRPHAVARVPAKTCLDFSSGFWSNSTDSRRSRTLVSNTGTW